jgi:hypothetical protein
MKNCRLRFARPIIRVGFLLSMAFGGCLNQPGVAKRDATFEPYEDNRIGSEPVRDYLRARTGFLLSGKNPKVDREPSDPARIRIGFSGGWTDTIGVGAATAIDRRGYFLTAAHGIIGKNPVAVVVFDKDGFALHGARVVWISDRKNGNPDLAILSIDQPLNHVFEWGPLPKAGDVVLSAGPSPRHQFIPPKPGQLMQFYSGKTVSLPENAKKIFSGHAVVTDSPLHVGDSGGPMISLDGRLVAISVAAYYEGYTPVVAPLYKQMLTGGDRPADVQTLKQIIDDDFTKRQTSAAKL